MAFLFTELLWSSFDVCIKETILLESMIIKSMFYKCIFHEYDSQILHFNERLCKNDAIIL